MLVRILIAALALSTSLCAQSVYVDFGANPPSSSYAGLAAAPGVWNALPFSNNQTLVPAVDTLGLPGSIQMLLDWGCDQGVCPTSIGGGDDGLLLSDWFNADCYATQHRITMSGLSPGPYRVRVYGFGEVGCNGLGPGMLVSNTPDAFCRGAIGPWTGTVGAWNQIDYVTIVGRAGSVLVSFGAGSYSGPAGIQFEKLSEDIIPYCFGAQGTCPCPGSDLNTTGGCAASFSPAGGTIAGSGAPIVGNDSLTLVASNMSSAAATLIQGSAMLNAQWTFGDGLRCVDGVIVRLITRFAPGGTLVYPQAGDPALSIAGGVPAGGGMRYYQGWFRDSAPFCTTATFNLTSAVAVVWR